jgi:hypothetical protein
VLRRLIILDIALTGILVLGSMKLYRDWLAFAPAHDLSAIQPQPDAFPAVALAATPSSTGSEDWTEIPTRNPFSFDRNDIAILVQRTAPVESGPKPVLFGIMSLGGPRLALVAPGRPPGNRNSTPRQAGETIDGWTIVQIDAKSVMVESNGVRETILMNDPTAQVPREYARTETGGAAPVVVQASGSSAPSTEQAGTASEERAASGTNTPPAQPRTRVIQTPFGTVRQVIEDPQQ